MKENKLKNNYIFFRKNNNCSLKGYIKLTWENVLHELFLFHVYNYVYFI